jgi:UDP-N-acetylglucosamine 2-epimerase
MRVLTVLGTRPQIVKAAPVSRALAAAGHEEVLVHTGQHYDRVLTEVLPAGAAPAAAYALEVGSDTHAVQAAEGARGVVAVAARVRPRCVLVAGDTNSALAAALGARSAGVPLAHGEAGVRLGSLSLPEEVNRIAVDHLADLLLCPTERAAREVRGEHPRGAAVFAGDPLLDALRAAPPRARDPSLPGTYYLATLHRAENTDDPVRLLRILRALASLPHPVVAPLHPRTREALGPGGLASPGPSFRAIDPVPHGALLGLLAGAAAAITDSGGLQREAYWSGVPCVLLREACEWRETVEEGWCVLAGADPARIGASAAEPPRGPRPPDLGAFGAGDAAARWVRALEERFG